MGRKRRREGGQRERERTKVGDVKTTNEKSTPHTHARTHRGDDDNDPVFAFVVVDADDKEDKDRATSMVE
eukprot:EC685800.1.p6 GENE.EC685800.1~~EC685800.1.p6  ORF type:complete len:70 (-),score=25.05 EC685800.1:139-348(-)